MFLSNFYRNSTGIFQDYGYDSPVHELSMFCKSVKEVDRLTLELNGLPDENLCIKLRFDRTPDAANWYQHLQGAVEKTIEATEIVSAQARCFDQIYTPDIKTYTNMCPTSKLYCFSILAYLANSSTVVG